MTCINFSISALINKGHTLWSFLLWKKSDEKKRKKTRRGGGGGGGGGRERRKRNRVEKDLSYLKPYRWVQIILISKEEK